MTTYTAAKSHDPLKNSDNFVSPYTSKVYSETFPFPLNQLLIKDSIVHDHDNYTRFIVYSLRHFFPGNDKDDDLSMLNLSVTLPMFLRISRELLFAAELITSEHVSSLSLLKLSQFKYCSNSNEYMICS